MKNSLRVLATMIISAGSFLWAQQLKPTTYPILLQGELPIYPIVAKTARLSGTVRIRVHVQDGQVAQAEIISGNPLLASATIHNVKTWKFRKEVNAVFESIFEYRLTTGETESPLNSKMELGLPRIAVITATPTQRPCEDCDSDIRPAVVSPEDH